MKQVRILKNGSHDGISYKKGEIWEYLSDYIKGETIRVIKDSKKTIVSINENNNKYGKEAEFIEKEPNNLNLIL